MKHATTIQSTYATKEDTVKTLTDLGFIRVSVGGDYFDAPKQRNGFPIVQARVYQCRLGYHCVDLEGGFMAPCVWTGPKADWDTSDTTQEFVAWLDKHFPNWK